MLKNRLLKKIFGPRREDVMGDCIMRSFIKYYYSDQIMDDKMDRAYNAHGRKEKCIQHFGWKT